MVIRPYFDQTDDFTAVVEALQSFTRRTQLPTTSLSGWDVENEAIAPPAGLLRQLNKVRMRPTRYTYSRDFAEARARAAALFAKKSHRGAEPPPDAGLPSIRAGNWKREAGKSGATRTSLVPLSASELAILPNSSQAIFLALSALRTMAQDARCPAPTCCQSDDRKPDVSPSPIPVPCRWSGNRENPTTGGGTSTDLHAVVVSPMYFGAMVSCRHLGYTITSVPSCDYLTGALDIPAIVATITTLVEQGQRCVVMLTNPAYSIGVEYSQQQLRALFDALPPGTPILLDETRLGMHWQSDDPWYAMDYPESAIIVRSPSKIFFLNGAKISFVIANAAIIREMERQNEALLG